MNGILALFFSVQMCLNLKLQILQMSALVTLGLVHAVDSFLITDSIYHGWRTAPCGALGFIPLNKCTDSSAQWQKTLKRVTYGPSRNVPQAARCSSITTRSTSFKFCQSPLHVHCQGCWWVLLAYRNRQQRGRRSKLKNVFFYPFLNNKKKRP